MCFINDNLFRYIIVVEHDLSVLDYLSDYICCLYGVPGAYGVVTMPFSVREGKSFFFFLLSDFYKCVKYWFRNKYIFGWICTN